MKQYFQKYNFQTLISRRVCEISLSQMPTGLIDDKLNIGSGWCWTAPRHYLSQCRPRSMSPYGITRPHWVNNHTLQFISKQIPIERISKLRPKLNGGHFVNDILRCFSWHKELTGIKYKQHCTLYVCINIYLPLFCMTSQYKSIQKICFVSTKLFPFIIMKTKLHQDHNTGSLLSSEIFCKIGTDDIHTE